MGTFSNGSIKTGYAKLYTYDRRLASNSPPCFPGTGLFRLVSCVRKINSFNIKDYKNVNDMVHVHSNVIGAVVILTPSPSSGNVIGNGNGSILYSTEAIQTAFKQIGINGGSLNYGFGNNRLYLTNWLE